MTAALERNTCAACEGERLDPDNVQCGDCLGTGTHCDEHPNWVGCVCAKSTECLQCTGLGFTIQPCAACCGTGKRMRVVR